MTEEKRESTRELLDEIEQGWSAADPSDASVGAERPNAPFAEKTAPASPSSSSDVDALDLGWLDNLFPDGEDDEDEDEPELPDERLDPVAFAAAKKEREERLRTRKEKRRAKADAKRARQRARFAVARQKQKTKKARPASQRPVKRPELPALSAADDGETTRPSTPPAKLRAKAAVADKQLAKKRANTIASVKLLAIVLIVLVGAAALAAVLAR